MTKIEKAQVFAHEAHDSIKQVRKYTGAPYWVHTDAVAEIVAFVGGDENQVCAAHLHDVLEDVKPINPEYNAQRILNEFGDDVMDIVIDLTDVYTKVAYPKLNRKQRHELENKRLAIIPPRSQTVKLADLINNTASIVVNDPDFAKVYLPEKLAILPLLSDGNPVLLNRASMQTIIAFQTLGLTIPMLRA